MKTLLKVTFFILSLVIVAGCMTGLVLAMQGHAEFGLTMLFVAGIAVPIWIPIAHKLDVIETLRHHD